MNTSFVGRTRELAQLDGLSGQILTVLGAAGIGKTRLALEHARTRTALVCDLCEARDRGALCAVLAEGLGVKLREPTDLRLLGLALAERGAVLVVLDNFEQLVHEASALVELAQSAPLVTLLVTSRVRLDLPEETVLHLGSQPDDEATELLVDRARQARPAWTPSPEDLPRIAALCRELDGIPLAIELAAARIRVMSLAQIEANLSRRFLLLSRADGTAGRQSTLQRALDWSWELLSLDEKAALAQCAVFRGGFTLEAAEAVLVVSSWIPDVLQSLCDQSLVGLHEPERFSMYASVREYAEARLQQDAVEVRARHARHFAQAALSWADELDLLGVRSGWPRLRAEAENLLAAHRFAASEPGMAEQTLMIAIALGTLYARDGTRPRYVELVSDALAAAEQAGIAPGLRARGLRRLGDFLSAAGRHDEAVHALTRSVSLAERTDPAVAVRGWLSLTKLELRKARYDAAAELLQRAETLASQVNDAHGELIVRNLLGSLEHARGQHARSAEHHRRALALARRLGDRHLEGLSLSNLGDYEIERGSLGEARVYLTEAIEIQRELGEVSKEMASLAGLGIVALEEGENEAALRYFEQATTAVGRTGDRLGQATWLMHLAIAQQAAGALDDALLSYDRTLELCEEVGTPLGQISALAWRASLRVRLGSHLQPALLDLEEARRRVGELQHPVLDAMLGVLGGVVEVAAARQASGPAAATALLASLQARYAPTASLSYDVRLALRELQRVNQPSPQLSPSVAALTVARGGLWFQPPGGERVELEQRRSLRLLLEALARARLAQPDTPLSSSALLEAGWPGERMTAEAGRTRLYSAIYSLRTLGLRSLLKKRDDGYLLDPTVPLSVC